MTAGHHEINQSATECPSRDVLADLALGKLPLETINMLGEHVEVCSTCQGILDSFDDLEDSVIREVKGVSVGDVPPPNPKFNEQIQRAKLLCFEVWREQKLDEPASDPPPNLGPYDLHEQIGQGGMATVYRATHRHLKRQVAVKVLSNHSFGNEQAVIRFQREMEAVGRLDHPHLVRAYDAGEVDGQHFLAMELIDGVDLSRLVCQTGPLPVADACEFVRQAAVGLHHAHEHGLVHRDVKPSNLMLTRDGTVKVLDLGLARINVLPEEQLVGELTATSTIMGTADYMAPEQALDTRTADHRADIYSLGCTLYYLLTAQPPYLEKTLMQKILAHREQPVPSLRQVREEVPAPLDALFQWMLAKTPEERPQSIMAAIAAIESAIEAKINPNDATQHWVEILPEDSESKLRNFRQGRYYGTVDAMSIGTGQSVVETDTSFQETEISQPTPPFLSKQQSAEDRTQQQTAPRKWTRTTLWKMAVLGIAVTFMAALLTVRFKTPAGTVVIKFSQPALAGAEVTIDGEKKITLKTGEGQETIEIEADEKTHTIQVTKGGFETFTKRFIARGGNRETVTVWLEPLLKPAKPTSVKPIPVQEAPSAKLQAGEIRSDNALKIKLVWCPSGIFTMGSPVHEKGHRADESYVEVTLTEGFWLGQTEVTEQQWQQLMGSELWRGWHWNSNKVEHANYPAANISWEDATAFCQRLTETERKAGRLTADREYALPTEAQWEYACRAGTKTVYSFGNDITELDDHAWFEDNANRDSKTHAHPVATKKANPWGLYDMHGNVWEWCRDWYEPRLTGGRDPLVSTAGSARILRGGCCWRDAGECRSGARSRSIPSNRYYSLGFRVALVPSSE